MTIGADHVTLNLNGHRIFGSGNVGIFSNHVGVVVQNGSVGSFATNDVLLAGASSRVMNMRVGQSGGAGVTLFGANDVVSGNRVFASGGSGIVGSGAGSQYTNNVLQSNAAAGIFAEDASVVSGNKALNNASDGIFISNPAGAAMTVTNNLANGNAHGILEDVGNATVVTLTGNQAFFNVQLGISATPGVTDGGHNKASGNGALEQCTNIVCS